MNNSDTTTTILAAVSIYQQQQQSSTLIEKNKLSSFLHHLPPTPSSSSTTATSSSYFGSTNATEKTRVGLEFPSSLQSPVLVGNSSPTAGASTTTETSPQHKYGSLGSSTPYLKSISRPITPSQTTISPNDNDEGLYLLWTQQLLRERGFTPSPCRLPDEKDGILNGNEEEDDDDSSVSDMSSILSSEEEQEEEREEDDEQHIAEQRRLFSPASRRPSSLYAYSQRASMLSRYSSTTGGAGVNNVGAMDDNDEDTLLSNSSRSPISTFFHNYFSFCF